MVLLACANLHVTNIEIILGYLEVQNLKYNIVSIFQKLCPNFIFKNSLFFPLSQNFLGKTAVNMVDTLFKDVLITYFAIHRWRSSICEGVMIVLAVFYLFHLVVVPKLVSFV